MDKYSVNNFSKENYLSVEKKFDCDFVFFIFNFLYSSDDIESAVNISLSKIGMKYEHSVLAIITADKKSKVFKVNNLWKYDKGIYSNDDILKFPLYFRFEENLFQDYKNLFFLNNENIDNTPNFISEEAINKGVKSFIISCFYEDEEKSEFIFYGNKENKDLSDFHRQTLIEVSKIMSVFIRLNKDNKQINMFSLRDPITGLYNYDEFVSKLSESIKRIDDKLAAAVCYFDIDNFSYVNETFGYKSGDNVLLDFSKEIKENDNCFGCRVYSDFFVMFFVSKSKDDIINKISEKNNNFINNQKLVYPASDIRVSTGIYFVENKDYDAATAIDNANLARKSIKDKKGELYGIYNESMRIERSFEQSILGELHEAIDKNHLKLYLQPKFDLKTRKIVGAEALVRWKNQDGKMKYPDQFIPVLEKTGYIIELDFFMYEKTLQFMRKWIDDGKTPIPVSVNFSRVHINIENFVERVNSLAEKYNVDKGLIELEITESSLLNNSAKMKECILNLRNKGFKIDIDDFGTGYSNFKMLLDIPADVVKIDKSFLDSGFNSEKKKEYIKQMGVLIYSTDNEIIFEGVETEEQANFLLDCGFRFAQGYLFEKPIYVDDFESKYIY